MSARTARRTSAITPARRQAMAWLPYIRAGPCQSDGGHGCPPVAQWVRCHHKLLTCTIEISPPSEICHTAVVTVIISLVPPRAKSAPVFEIVPRGGE